MPVDTKHPEYELFAPDWQIMRDTISGQRAMQVTSRDYLRRPSGLEDELEWSRYVNATPFFEATQRSAEGMTGLAFYREPEITLPDGLKDFVDDATQDGVPLRQFVEAILEETLELARVGILVDFPPKDPNITTRSQEEKARRRPFVRQYLAENIINWKTGDVNGVVRLTQVRLWEIEDEEDPADEFTPRWRYRIRVLSLDKGTDGAWTYRQRIFTHKDWQTVDGKGVPEAAEPVNAKPPIEAADEWSEGAPIVPMLRAGVFFDYIPFWICNPVDQTPGVKRPPLLGLANTNIAHFNTTGALENVLFWVGNPQPYITGMDPETAPKLRIGSSTAWIFKDANAKADFLSIKSEDFAGLEKRLEKLEGQMAVLGARMLAADPKGVETAETARIHRQGEISILARICGSVSRTISDVCKTVADWSGVSGDCKVQLNTSFFDAEISFADAMAATNLWQKGFMGPSDVLSILKRGEIVSADRTLEQIHAENQSSPIQPIIPNMTTGGPTPSPAVIPVRPKLTPKPAPTPPKA